MAKQTSQRLSGPFVYLSVLAGFGVAMVVVKPLWDDAGHDSVRAECTVNLELIADRQAEIIAETSRALPCAAWPVEPPGPDGTAWDEFPTCWQRLGFERGLILHGRYVVDTTLSGWTARCTVEIDGSQESWQATDALTAQRVDD